METTFTPVETSSELEYKVMMAQFVLEDLNLIPKDYWEKYLIQACVFISEHINSLVKGNVVYLANRLQNADTREITLILLKEYTILHTGYKSTAVELETYLFNKWLCQAESNFLT
jgi:hypothetical protein